MHNVVKHALAFDVLLICTVFMLMSSCDVPTGLNTVAKPVFNPPGGLYPSARQISISCATPGAAIYYTLDGSNPTESSLTYSVPINVAANATIQARCFKSGWAPSKSVCALYVLSTLQTADATIYYAEPNFNDGAAEYLKIGNYWSSMTGGVVDDDRALVRFDLSVVPSGNIVSSAQLKLYYYDHYGNYPILPYLSVERLTLPWDESTVTWANQTPLLEWGSRKKLPNSTNQWMVWNVSADVQGFINGSLPNYGWGVKHTGWTDIVHFLFRSREYGLEEQRPTLEIYFAGKAEPMIIR